jgi:hypothetical protein
MHRALTLAPSAPSLILKFVFSAIVRAFTMTHCHLLPLRLGNRKDQSVEMSTPS